MTCRLRAHISTITMIAGKSGQRRFWYKKKTQFLSHFNPKIPHQHPYNTQNHYVNSKYLKKIAQEPEIKPGNFGFLGLNLVFYATLKLQTTTIKLLSSLRTHKNPFWWAKIE